MKKIFVCFILATYMFMPCISSATMLSGGVEKVWTVKSAKEEVFKDAKPYVNLSQYPPIDPNYNENLDLIGRNELDEKNRHITVFSDGAYAVRYYNAMCESYYYNKNGNLYKIEFSIYSKNVYTMDDINKYTDQELFPMKRYDHAYPSGSIIGVGISPKYMEDYSFLPNGKLIMHSIGNNCYDANNNLIMTRTSE